jgi:hypothetical protein
MLPTVDHRDPLCKEIDFQICSWLINMCKSDQTPDEFITMCRDIVAYRPANRATTMKFPKTYFLPDFLNGICTEAVYKKWLKKRAEELYARDFGQRRPYALGVTAAFYQKKIHEAVIAAGVRDPYTGETLDWKLIDTWDMSKDQPVGYARQFRLLPTVDHVDPWANDLEFEICSLRINCCKGGLTPDEFVDVCRKVAEKALNRN